MSARPSRRAATRRKQVVESSSSEDEPASTLSDYEEAPAPTPKRRVRKTVADTPSEAATPKPRRKARTSEAPSSVASRRTPATARRGTKRARKPDTDEEEEEKEEDVEATPRADPALQLAMEEEEHMRMTTPTPAPSSVPATPSAKRSSVAETPSTPAQQQESATSSLAPTPRAKLRVGDISPVKNSSEPADVEMAEPEPTQQGPEPTPQPARVSPKRAPSPIVIKNRAQTLAMTQQEPTKLGPRLVITHLVLINFKSYAGRQEVGPFHPSFSSVVGPNGSGKSNVIDSLLFVFGFRASKMRQGKISALIHNSAAFPNLEYCEVEVHFQEIIDQPDGGHEVVPNSTLVVSRKAFKNNSSKYYINGKTSDYTQVTGMLRERGIDLDHKRFLILQGEVESIAQMKAKAQGDNDDGLLEYLEDIIGTSKYKQPIEESAAQVEELNDVCQEKQSRVHIVEKEKNALEDKKNGALEYIENENELAIKKATLYQMHIADSEANIQVTSEMMAQLQTELDAELENHRGNEDDIKKLQRKYEKGQRMIEEIEQATQAVLREVARYDKESVKHQEKEKFLVQKQKKLQKAIQTNRLAASEATALIERHGGDSERYKAEIEELEGRLETEQEELQKIIASVQDKTRPFSEQIAVKQKSLEPWNEKINQKKSAIAVAQSELDLLHENANAAATALEEVQAKIATIEESRQVKEAELQENRKEKARLEKQLQKTRAELEKLNQKEPQMRGDLTASRQKADEARSSFAASKTQGNVLTGLMRLKDSGRIEGFHGRLGNLGTIDAKYDVAISTACPSLENMVVDTVEAGQQCINYLRKNNLGRAKFICLDKLSNFNMNPIQTPENAPRLFDLVKPKNPAFRPAFYSVLTDTLVANDLAQANRLAYGAKRWRVVTLDGQLIDKSGTMTGGGTTVQKGRMSSKAVSEVSPELLRRVESERDEMEQAFAQFEDRQRELQQAVRELTERIPELDVTMSKIELEISSGERHLADAQKRVAELKQAQAAGKNANKGGIAALEKQIASLEQEMEALIEETSGIEEEISALNDKISQVGGAKLRGQKSKVEGIREQLDLLNEQISAADMNRTKAEKQKAKSEKALASAEQELETIGAELEELKQTIKEHEAAAAEAREKADEDQADLEDKKEQLAAFKETLEAKVAELNATRAAEIEMRNKLEEYAKTLHDNKKRAKHWRAELDKLVLQDIADLSGEVPEGEDHEPPSLPMFTEDELRDMNKNALVAEIATLEEKTQNVSVDLAVLADYRRRVEEHTARSADLNQAVADRDAVKQRLDDLRKRRLEEFMDGFNTISLRLKEMYQMITMGGNAELELVDSLDPFSEGILFSVMPPKKSWKNISNLSGGEKTLSSLALVFALHHYKPTPLYVMDEIDAALDFRNVSIVASYIKERTKNAQFVVISLRNNMFELAARLVGVYKVNHMTKSVTIENKDYVKKDGEEKAVKARAPPTQMQPTQMQA